MEKYSVLMSLYWKEKPEYLVTAIDSMLNQTVKSDEIVIVEDGPLTEELYNVLDGYGERIKRIKNEKNLGLGLALNIGLKHCRNELVARMDTDDISKVDRCEKQLLYMEMHKDVAIVGGQIQEFVGKVGNIRGKRVVPCDDIEIKKFMKKRCPFNHMTVFFRKSEIIDVGSYQDWFYNEDYYLWIRLALKNTKFANLSDVLVDVRTSEDMYQRRGGKLYFESEKKIQLYLKKNKIISWSRYIINISERFFLQVLFPNKMRKMIFEVFARK